MNNRCYSFALALSSSKPFTNTKKKMMPKRMFITTPYLLSDLWVGRWCGSWGRRGPPDGGDFDGSLRCDFFLIFFRLGSFSRLNFGRFRGLIFPISGLFLGFFLASNCWKTSTFASTLSAFANTNIRKYLNIQIFCAPTHL